MNGSLDVNTWNLVLSVDCSKSVPSLNFAIQRSHDALYLSYYYTAIGSWTTIWVLISGPILKFEVQAEI
jgi:hypothetical protein